MKLHSFFLNKKKKNNSRNDFIILFDFETVGEERNKILFWKEARGFTFLAIILLTVWWDLTTFLYPYSEATIFDLENSCSDNHNQKLKSKPSSSKMSMEGVHFPSKVTSMQGVTLPKHKQLYMCFEKILSTF